MQFFQTPPTRGGVFFFNAPLLPSRATVLKNCYMYVFSYPRFVTSAIIEGAFSNYFKEARCLRTRKNLNNR